METEKLIFTVGEKGGVLVYGLGQRFPVTLYGAQWIKLLAAKDELLQFIADNKDKLKPEREPKAET